MRVASLVPMLLLSCVPRPESRTGWPGGFGGAPDVRVVVGTEPSPPLLDDLDGDGDVDVILAVQTGAPAPGGRLVALIGDGEGRFEPRAGLDIGSPSQDLAIGDVDGDWSLDVLVGWHDEHEVGTFLGDGRGGFTRSAAPLRIGGAGPAHTHCVRLGDVNRDRFVDLLGTSADEGTVTVLLGDGRGAFDPSPGSPFPAAKHPYDTISIADFDGDGSIDVAVPDLHGAAVSVLLGDGAGRFAPAVGSPIAVGDRPGYLTHADLDGDGDFDVVVTHDDDPVAMVLVNDGAARFSRRATLAFAKPVWTVAAGDVDGDRAVDLAFSSHGARGVYLCRGHGDATFSDAVWLDAGGATGAVALADVDGDHALDLLATDVTHGALLVWRAQEDRARPR